MAPTKTSFYQNKWFITLAVVASLLLATFLARGWLRVTAGANVVNITYGQKLKKDVKAYLAQTGQPFEALGYTTNDITSSCYLFTAEKLHTEYECSYTVHAYKEAPTNDAGKKAMNQGAQTIQDALKAHRWDGEYGKDSPYTSLTTLVGNITSGIDYTPDAAYQIHPGAMRCIFDSQTAFSVPKPAAISSIFSCTRTIKVF